MSAPLRHYYCNLSIHGRADHVEYVQARNKREAAKQASRQHDEYANRNRMTGHRVQKTPASHWRVNP